MPKIAVPASGRAMTFQQWSTAIVDALRTFLPDAKAVRKGHRLVIIRCNGRRANLVDDGSFWLKFPPKDGSLTGLPCLYHDRRDAFTVGNLAHSIAGHFDSRYTEEKNEQTN